MWKYALAGVFVFANLLYYVWQPSSETESVKFKLTDDATVGSGQVTDGGLGATSDAIIRQEAKVLSTAALTEPATSTLADDSMVMDLDADDVPLTSLKQPRALGIDLDAEDLLGRPNRPPKALGPDLDLDDITLMVSRPQQRLGKDIDVEAYEATMSQRTPQSLGDDIDVIDACESSETVSVPPI